MVSNSLKMVRLFLLSAVIAATSLIAPQAHACDPALIPVSQLLENGSMIVKGRMFRAKAPFDPKPAMFRVEKTLRGDIPPGEYRIAEGGPFGNQCEYGEIGMSYPDRAEIKWIGDPAEEDARYLFVSKQSGNLLVTPIGHGYGLGVSNGIASDGRGRMDAKALEAYLQGAGPLPEWKEGQKQKGK